MTTPFQIVGERRPDIEHSPQDTRQVAAQASAPPLEPSRTDESAVLVAVLSKMLNIGILGQKFAIALAKLFSLATVASAFSLWVMTPSPDTVQVVSLTIYAAFILAVNVIVLWRKQ